MKMTKRQLRQIIKEEVQRLFEVANVGDTVTHEQHPALGQGRVDAITTQGTWVTWSGTHGIKRTLVKYGTEDSLKVVERAKKNSEIAREMRRKQGQSDVDNDGTDSDELRQIAATTEEDPGVDLRGIRVTPQSIAALKSKMRRSSGHISGPRTKDVPVGVYDPRTGKVRTK